MEDSSVKNVFQAYFESYKVRNLETREIDQLSCEDGIQWVWLMFAECLLSPAHKVGYLAGAVSLLFWAFGYVLTCTQIQSAQYLWKLLILTFIVNLVSFVGAVMSLQIMFLISYDMLTIIILVVGMLGAAVVMLTKLYPGRHRYQPVCNMQNPMLPAPTEQQLTGVTPHKACCIPLYLGICLLLSVVFVSVASRNVLRESSSSTAAALMELQHQVPLNIAGYVLGCLASCGRWWIEILILSQFVNEMRGNRVWKGGGVMLMISDVFYVVGVLLQSGSFRVTIVTLPWLIGRVAQGCIQIFKITASSMLSCPVQKYDAQSDDKTDDENVNETEAVVLIGSSESEVSNVHVLFDRSWDAPGQPSVHPPLEDSMASALSASRELTAHDVTTTTDSELSSTCQEQELIWEDEVTTLRIPTSVELTNQSRLRHQRLSLASQIEILSQTSSETSDQRVRSWISQSTPEEESPPCLTLTLNLDTTYDSVKYMSDEHFGNRKFYFCGPLPLSPRKNSF